MLLHYLALFCVSCKWDHQDDARREPFRVCIRKQRKSFRARWETGGIIVKSLNYFSLHREKRNYKRHPENSRNFRRIRSVERSSSRLSKQAQDYRYLEGNKSFVVAFKMNNRREIPLRQAALWWKPEIDSVLFTLALCRFSGPLRVTFLCCALYLNSKRYARTTHNSIARSDP